MERTASPSSRLMTAKRPGIRRRWIAWTLLILAPGTFLSVSGCMERLFYWPVREATPPPAAYQGVERVRFSSADGTPLVGWFIPAQRDSISTAERPAPTIIHAHGNAGSINDHLYFSEYLPEAGFNLFLFDYRGYGESGGKARRRADLIADTHAALDAVLTRDDVDSGRIGFFGHSLGGAIALAVMAEREEVRAAAIMSAFSDWRGIAADSIGGGPIASFFAGLLIPDGHSAKDAIARIDRPLLLIHGGADRIVPARHGRDLSAAAPHARWAEIAGGGHNDLRTTHPEVDELIVEFLHAELADHPGPSGPPSGDEGSP